MILTIRQNSTFFFICVRVSSFPMKKQQCYSLPSLHTAEILQMGSLCTEGSYSNSRVSYIHCSPVSITGINLKCPSSFLSNMSLIGHCSRWISRDFLWAHNVGLFCLIRRLWLLLLPVILCDPKVYMCVPSHFFFVDSLCPVIGQ